MKKYYFITLLIIISDQLTKWLVVNYMTYGGPSLEIVPNWLYFTSHRNSGAAWGVLQDQMIFFYILTTIVVVAIIYVMWKHGAENSLLALSLAIILGGAIGNFIDRIFRKEVVDFIRVDLFNFPIFNIADMALTFGVMTMFIYVIKDEKMKKEKSNGAI